MMKKVLYFSVLCLLFVTISYTYSSFTNKIVGNIVATSNNWSFKVNVENGSIENDYYKVPITSSSGQVNITLNTSSSNNGAEYTIELTGYNLPSDIAYYKDSSYTNMIGNNIYKGNINKNTSKTVTIYYKSSSTINGYLYIKVKGSVSNAVAMMKNGYSNKTEFWKYYASITTAVFTSDDSNKPTECTAANKCWDVSYDANQDIKIYAYIIANNLYVVSDAVIAAPIDCTRFFYNFSKLTSINFNNYFDTSEVTNMNGMFLNCTKLTSLDLSSFNTSKVTNMFSMFSSCSSLIELDLGNLDTSNVIDFGYMFNNCYELITTIVIRADSSKVTNYSYMFWNSAIHTNARIIVNYTADASALVDAMLHLSEVDSNDVVKGSLVS